MENSFPFVCVHGSSVVFDCLWPHGACQAPLSMQFSRWDYISGLPFPSPGGLPDPGIKPMSLVSPALAHRFFTSWATGEAQYSFTWNLNPWDSLFSIGTWIAKKTECLVNSKVAQFLCVTCVVGSPLTPVIGEFVFSYQLLKVYWKPLLITSEVDHWGHTISDSLLKVLESKSCFSSLSSTFSSRFIIVSQINKNLLLRCIKAFRYKYALWNNHHNQTIHMFINHVVTIFSGDNMIHPHRKFWVYNAILLTVITLMYSILPEIVYP